ncbi:MAG: hypothetical protein ACW98K_02135 [Candidatus Kariarchaeaceae archaeon]
MVGSTREDLMVNRLLVLLQIIAIPLYFTFFSILWHDELKDFFEDKWLQKTLPDWLIWFEINLAIPIFFSLPWVLISLLRATKIADAYTLMGRALGKVRIDQKLFYGLNAAFTLIFLLLPVGGPLITVIGVFILFRIGTRKVVIGRISKLFWLIPALIISIIPGLIAIAFYANYSELLDRIFDIWQDYIDRIFYIGLCLAVAISIGNFLYFLYERRKKFVRMELDPYRLIYVLKLVFFGFFLFVYFELESDQSNPKIINGINLAAGILVAIEFILRRVNDIPSDSSGANLMVFAFIFINLGTRFIKEYIPIDTFRAFLIILSGSIFFVLFLLSYRYAEDKELFD